MIPCLYERRILRFAGLVLAGALVAGCVTYEEQRLRASPMTTLTVARAGESVSIQFPSEKGVMYTILWTANLNSRSWEPLPNAVRVMGTGELMAFEDHVPNGIQRYYRLQSWKIDDRSRHR